MIDESRLRGQPDSVEFHLGDVYSLTFPDDSFDAVRADRVFQHLLDPSAALAEMRRVTVRRCDIRGGSGLGDVRR